MTPSNRTVILGGGFTGLFAALYLSRRRYGEQIVLVDRDERFSFKPLLYELLSGELDAFQVWPRFEELLRGSRIIFIQDSIKSVDLKGRRVELGSGLAYSYKHLVLALGGGAGKPPVEGADRHAFAFRGGEDVLALRQHLRNCLQQASQSEDPKRQQQLLTAVVVGGGPTGVELAATLADWLPEQYHRLGGSGTARVVVLQRGDRLLPQDMSLQLRTTAEAALTRRATPVEVVLGAGVSAIGPEGVTFTHGGNSETTPSATVIWTGGGAANLLVSPLKGMLPHGGDQNGRLSVTQTLQLQDFPEVFAAGDLATDPDHPLPATAQAAYQQGEAIARNLLMIEAGRPPTAMPVRLLGTMAKLGLGEAAVEVLDRYEIRGRPAHLLRQFRYLGLLPSPVHGFQSLVHWLIDQTFRGFGTRM